MSNNTNITTNLTDTFEIFSNVTDILANVTMLDSDDDSFIEENKLYIGLGVGVLLLGMSILAIRRFYKCKYVGFTPESNTV